jgi:MFS family permease
MADTPIAASRKAVGAVSMSNAQRWYTLIVLTAIYTSSHVDRTIFGVLSQSIKVDLGLSDTALGFMGGTAFGLFYATLGIPLALWADRTNRRNIIAGAITIWSAMTAVCGLAGNFWQLALARVGVGIGEAGSSPQSHSIIADLFPAHERSRAMAIYALGVVFGGMIAFGVGGWVVTEYGWRVTFFIVGLPGILLGLLIWLTVQEPQRGHADGLSHEIKATTFKETMATLGEAFAFLWKSRACRHTILGITLTSFVGYGGAQWATPFLMRTHHMTQLEVGLFLAPVAGVLGGLGALLGGYFADRFGKKDIRLTTWIVAFAKYAAFVFVLGFYLIDDTTTALAVYLPAAVLGAFYLGPSFAIIQSLAPVAMRATAAAIMLFIINIIGLGFGPQLVGIASDLLLPTFGNDSLRYALMFTSFINVWAATHYILAGNALARERK